MIKRIIKLKSYSIKNLLIILSGLVIVDFRDETTGLAFAKFELLPTN